MNICKDDNPSLNILLWNSFKSWHHIGMHDQSLDLLSGSKPFLTRHYKMSLSSFRKDVHMVSREWGLYVDPRMVYIITRLCICCYFWYCKEFLLHANPRTTAVYSWYNLIYLYFKLDYTAISYTVSKDFFTSNFNQSFDFHE